MTERADTQDGHARSEALAAIQNFSEELQTNRAKVANLEDKLVKEEAELDEVRESLKGGSYVWGDIVSKY